MNKLAITYLNRLSDLVFILARYANRERGDVLWVPGGQRGDRAGEGRRVSDDKKKAEDPKPKEPVDDLVVSHHTLRTTSRRDRLHRAHGSHRAARGGGQEGEVHRLEGRAPSCR